MLQKEINLPSYKILKNRGEKFHVNEDYNKALEYFKQALELCEKKVGKLHKDIASLYNNIGVIYLDTGKYSSSKTWLNKSLNTYKEIGEDTGIGIAFAYSNLGVLYSKYGKYNEALKNYTLARDIRAKIKGPKHKETLLVYFNMATIYIKKQKYDTALELLHKSYNILRKKIFDTNKYQYANTCNSIGLIHRKKGDLDSALKWYFKAIKIAKQTKVTTKGLLITIYGNISSIYRDRGKLSTSLEYQKKALVYINMVFSDTHPKAANINAEMGSVYYRQKNYDKAIEYSLKVVDIREKTLGVNHHDTALAYSNTGIYYFSKNDFPNSIKYYQKSSDSYYNYYGEKSQKYLKIYGELAKSYFHNTEYKKSAEIYEDLLAIRESLENNTKANIINLSYNIARCYEKLSDKTAIKWYTKCISVSVELYGESDNRTINIMNFLARTFFKLKLYDDSIHWYDKAINIVKQKSEINFSLILNMYLDKIAVYKSIEKIEKAIYTNIEALTYFNKNKIDDKNKIPLIYTLGFMYSNNQDFSNALKYFKDSLKLMENIQSQSIYTGHEYIYAKIYLEMAYIYQHYYSDYISSINYYKKCIEIHHKHYGNDINLALIYKAIAYPYSKMQKYDESAEFLHKAKKILLDLFDETHERIIEIDDILSNIHNQQYNYKDDDYEDKDISVIQ